MKSVDLVKLMNCEIKFVLMFDGKTVSVRAFGTTAQLQNVFAQTLQEQPEMRAMLKNAIEISEKKKIVTP